ncbi:MAG: TonB-dependent receptor [Cyclobacteriaceae bacterium]
MNSKLLRQLVIMSRHLILIFLLHGVLSCVLVASDLRAQLVNKSIDEIYLTIQVNDLSLDKTFKRLSQQTGFSFAFNEEMVDLKEKVNLNIKEGSLGDVLREISRITDLRFKRVNDNIHVALQDGEVTKTIEEILTDDQQSISGKVVSSEDGEGLPGVSITVKGSTSGTVTDANGNYSLEVPQGSTLIFSFVGFETREVSVGNQSEINVSMNTDVQTLEELVVVGYGSVKKSDLTGSVASVKAKDINSFPATNMLQALSGRAPGVQVLQTTGAPGAGLSVRIRGTNSIQGGNEPLYVIDGFPYSGNPTNINNSDIESIEILKDASATAIYGSRGANGVVLITTKSGKAGETRVDFESSYSSQSLRKKLELMNGREYAELANLQAINDNITPYFTQAELDAFGEGTDWQDIVFQEAPIWSSSLNVSGGNEKTQFSIGGSFFGQDGIVIGSDYDRYTLRTNISHEISKKFSVQLTNTATYVKTERRDSDGGVRGGSMINAAIAAAPISKPYDDDGTYNILAQEFPFVPVDIVNPLNYINEQTNVLKENVTLSNLAFIFKPIEEITIKVSGGIENRDSRRDVYTTRNFINSEGSASVNSGQFRSLLSENTISYNKTFGGIHSVSAVAGFTYQDFLSTSLSASGQGFLSDVFETYDLSAAATQGIANTNYSYSTLMSYLGRVNYTLNDKYLFTISLRADGSSRYSEGEKWGYFPSGAFAWRLYDEDFFNVDNVFSDLKVRASWGLTGSQAISPYSTLNLLSSGLVVLDDALFNTFAPDNTLPGGLQWETTEQINFGFDFGFLNNRILFTADYYTKNTRDLLNTVILPSSTGYTNTIRNVGAVKNTGVELAVDAKILTGEFKWNMNANISFNRNEVVTLQDGEDILGANTNVLIVRDNLTILREGRPIGQFYGWLEDGYDDNGLIVLQDLDGDGSITEDDKTYIGDPNPNFIYGINSNMSFKNFEFTLFFQGTYGNDIYNVSSIPTTIDYGQGINMPREVYLDNWTPENPNAKYPIVSRSVSGYNSDRWIEDGSFLRLRNIELAYNFPVNNISWLENAQLYLSGQNLITITNYSWWDPEVNSRGAGTARGIDHFTYPIAKSYTIGFRVGF